MNKQKSPKFRMDISHPGSKSVSAYHLLIGLLISGIAFTLYLTLIVYDVPQLADERHHLDQIQLFLDGNFQQLPMLTVIPGYHAVLAVIAYITGFHELVHIRLFSLLIGLIAVFVFYCCARELLPELALQRTLAFFLLPILFPYWFLIYVHSFSILLILLGIYSHITQRSLLAAIFLGLSVLVRQTNIVWVIMFFVIQYVETYGYRIELATLKKRRWAIVYGLIIGCFLCFVWWNGGVATGDAARHPLSLQVENIFFSLFIFFVLFWPFIIIHIPDMFAILRKKPFTIVLFSVAAGALYFVFFDIRHPYNLPKIFLHNIILQYFVSTPFRKIVSFLPMLLAIWSLLIFRLHRKSYYPFYVFWGLSLLPFSLIEQRYYIPIITMFLLFKTPENSRLEWGLAGYFLLLSLGICFALPFAGVFP